MKARTILLVDDDEDDREFFKIALKKCRGLYQLAECANGEQLFNYLKNQPAPDFIFLDINMPKINGIECLKLLAENYSIRTKVIMQSTAASPLVIDQCFDSGATAYIIKPDSTGVLEQLINYCFEKLEERKSRGDFILNAYVNSMKKI